MKYRFQVIVELKGNIRKEIEIMAVDSVEVNALLVESFGLDLVDVRILSKTPL